MKRIIMFVLLFAALKVAGQTTGYLRFDTVKIMKQNGTCELYVINKTKDSLGLLTNVGGGLTQFIKPKVLNDSAIVVGLDTLIIRGTGGGSGSATLSNVGSGYRLVKTADGQVKTEFAGYGINKDSTTNTDAITDRVDTTTLKAVYLPLHLNASKTIDQNSNNIYYTGAGELKSDSTKLAISHEATAFAIPGAAFWVGDSYTAGFRPDTPDTIFVDRLIDDYWQITSDNQGVSSRGIWKSAERHNILINPSNTAMTSVMSGFNDVRRGGISNEDTYRKIVGGHTSIFANHFLKEWVAAGSSGTGITRSGSWTTSYTSQVVGGKSSNNGAYTTTINDSIVYTFTDSTVVIGLIGADSSSSDYYYSRYDVYLDDVYQGEYSESHMADGISDGSNDNRRSPFAMYFLGLSYGNHKIKLVNKSATGANYFVVDYFGHLVDRINATPLLIWHAPYNTVTGFAVSPSLGSVAAIDKLNDKIDDLALTFGTYPVFIVPTNNFLDTLTGLASDEIHPNNTGDIQLTNAALSVLPSIATGATGEATDGTFLYTGVRPLFKNNSMLHQLAFLDDITTAGIGGSGTANTIPKFLSSTTLTNSSITDNGTTVAIGANTTINGTDVKIGTVFPTDANINIGILSSTTFPYWGFKNTSAGTNEKIYDFYVDNSGILHGRIVNDAANAASDFLAISRSATTVSAVSFPGGNFRIGSLDTDGSAPTTSGTTKMVITDDNGQLSFDDLPSAGTTLYSGDGTLAGDRTVSTGGFTTTWSGANDSETSFSVTNTGTTAASAIAGNVTGSTGAGVTGTSTTGNGVVGSSSSNYGVVGTSSTTAAFRGQINVASTDAIENIVSLLRTSSAGAGANGLGAAIQFELETATNGTSQTAGRLAFSWSDATNATRTSVAEIYAVNSGTTARKAALAGNGQWTWDGYGAGTHTVTPATTPVISSSGVVGERIAPKIYTALLTATAGNAPTATVLGTNEIGSIVWTRVADGNYTGTLSSAFTANKTWALVQRGDMSGNFVNNWISSGSTSTVTLTVSDNLGNPVGDFTNMSIEIRVYP